MQQPQSLALFAGSVPDIWSDVILNNRTLRELSGVGQPTLNTHHLIMYNYANIALNGPRFGLAALLELQDEALGCGGADFAELLHSYGLGGGVSAFLQPTVSELEGRC